jgi:Nucleotidyl transferase AbiEii toxin, Type IV TA system
MNKPRGPIFQDSDFRELLLEVSSEGRGVSAGKISPEFVEKDYWVTKTLATLVSSGLEVWFKGGTALAKGFVAVRRFSEDLDLMILGSEGCPLPTVESWTGQGKAAIQSRLIFFEALMAHLKRHGLAVEFAEQQDDSMRSANIQCFYPGVLKDRLSAPFKPFILLEIGNARVAPFVTRTISSFVHDFLETKKILKDYDDDRPEVRCTHPFVTLIEKLDAIARHYHRSGVDFRPEKFIRHYDDAAAVIAHLASPDVMKTIGMPTCATLVTEMLAKKDIRQIPLATDKAFAFNLIAMVSF